MDHSPLHLCLSWFWAAPAVDMNSHYVRGSGVGQTTALYRTARAWVKAKGKPRSKAGTTCVPDAGQGIPWSVRHRWPGSLSSTAVQFAHSRSHQTSDGLKVQNRDQYKNNKKSAGKGRISIKVNLNRWEQYFKYMHSGWISPGKKNNNNKKKKTKQNKKRGKLGINRTFFFPSHDTF